MAHDLQLNLDLLLPEAHDESDRCVHDLLDALRRTSGIHDAHLISPSGEGPLQICIDAAPDQISLARLAERARSVGAELSHRYGHAVWHLANIAHASRAENAAVTLRQLPGVLAATVTIGGTTRIEFDTTATTEPALLAAAQAAGLRFTDPSRHGQRDGHGHTERHNEGHNRDDRHPYRHDDDGPRHDDRHHDRAHDSAHNDAHAHDHHGHGGRGEVVIAATAFVVYLVARILDWTTDDHGWVTPLYIAAAGVTGLTVGRDVIATLRARRFDIEVLMWVAAAGAAAVGHWSEAALLLVLFSLGHSLEHYAMDRARRAISSMSDLAPATAVRRGHDGTISEVPVEQLAVGEVIIVRPHDRIAADGRVVTGSSSVDESPVTGESMPVDKSPAPLSSRSVRFDQLPHAHRVFAGTLNGEHTLDVEVIRPAHDSTLARVITLVTEAETQIAPSQAFTDKVVRRFIPAVFALVAVLLVVPPLLGEPFRDSFLRAMAVLVASSPCALAIATPSAVLAAIARAANGGVLVKGGGPLERLGQVQVIAFDKTGTLTEGRPRLVAVEPLDGVDPMTLLSTALAVEQLSDHPLATAITRDALEIYDALDPLEATQVSAVVGKGMTGMLNGETIAVGNAALFSGRGDTGSLPVAVTTTIDALHAQGITTVIVRRGDQFLGVLGVMDTPRPEAHAALGRLSDMGITTMVMLSGDQPAVAESVGAMVGISDARGGLLPEDKVHAIRALREQHPGGVAMIGDGVNDAPALATASVGVAMGAAGSDLALETADIALMADDLDRLPFAVGLARRASRVITQNLVFSLGMVAVLIPLTIAGIGIGPAVIAHEGSTLVVVLNALALLAHRDEAATSPPHDPISTRLEE